MYSNAIFNTITSTVNFRNTGHVSLFGGLAWAHLRIYVVSESVCTELILSQC